MTKTLYKIEKALSNPDLAQRYFESVFRKKLFTVLYYLTGGRYIHPPHRIAISVNSVCNARCLMCDVGQSLGKMNFHKNMIVGGGELSIEILRKLIDDTKSFDPYISINGTEPLLYKNLFKFIDYVVANGLKCSVTTNGILLEKHVDEFVEKKLPELNVSIDGPSAVHNKIRGINKAYEKAYEGIKQIIERKNALNETLPKIRIAYAISNYNYHCLEKTVEIFKELGVDSFSFSHLNFIDTIMANAHNDKYVDAFGRVSPSSISAVDPKKVDVGILTKQINTVKNKYSDFVWFLPDITTIEEIENYYYNSHKFVSSTRCSIPWENTQILGNGDVIPASRCFHVVMGNIHKDSFNTIWNNTNYRNFRNNLRKYGATPACARCCGIM